MTECTPQRRTYLGRLSMSLPLALSLAPLAMGCRANEDERKAPESGKEIVHTEKAEVQPEQRCSADPAWVSAPSMPDGSVFPGGENCDFHRWSVQSFLWLTSGNGKQLVFEGFANPKDLFVPEGPPPYPDRGADTEATMLARLGKNTASVDVEKVFQAGPGNEILVDRAGQVVYYANHLDRVFWDFVKQNKLWDLAALLAIQPDQRLDFPVDSLELPEFTAYVPYPLTPTISTPTHFMSTHTRDPGARAQYGKTPGWCSRRRMASPRSRFARATNSTLGTSCYTVTSSNMRIRA